MTAATNIKQALTVAVEKLQASSDSARIDVETLLCHVLNCNSAHLVAWPDKLLDEHQANQFNHLIERRLTGEPVAYITGHREFWSLDLMVSPATLIPRPETETLVEYVLENHTEQKTLKLLDMGTGSGAIAIALATEKPDWKITATDISTEALAIARRNADHHNVNHITFMLSDWFQAIEPEMFDVIVSNPPYIALDDIHMNLGDVRFEPKSALLSGKDGLTDIRTICSEASQYLNDNGWLIFEHGYDQKQAVYDCLHESGFHQIQQISDLAGQPRVSVGQYFR